MTIANAYGITITHQCGQARKITQRKQQEECTYDEVLDLLRMVPTYDLGRIK